MSLEAVGPICPRSRGTSHAVEEAVDPVAKGGAEPNVVLQRRAAAYCWRHLHVSRVPTPKGSYVLLWGILP